MPCLFICTCLIVLEPPPIQLSDLQTFLSGLNVPAPDGANQRSG